MKKAYWSYMPGFENYCEKCVPRGCSCNKELKDGVDYDSPEAENPENYIEKLDNQGRKIPCCEYSEINEEDHIDFDLINETIKDYEENEHGWGEEGEEDENEYWERIYNLKGR